MLRSIMTCLVMLGLSVCVGCKAKTDMNDTEATITKVDAKKGIVDVKMKRDGKDVEKTFKLAETIQYMDSAGDVANAEIFTSGDRVLIFESEGTITKMKNKDKAVVAKLADSKGKNEKEAKNANETFVRTADQINLSEMELGKIAEGNAKSDVVKKFGARAVSDHSNMNKELRKITSKEGISLTEKLDPKNQELLDALSKSKDVAFDKAYTKDMVEGHEKAIELFENEAKNGKDSDVKAWAQKCLPTLREHLKLAQAAVKDVKGN